MELYLHIGTEKTGSSYLQTLMANNRKQFKEEGIYFPDGGKREKDMLSGKISPGNAQNLCDSLKAQNYKDVEWILKIHCVTANQKGLKKILLSNEVLMKELGNDDVFDQFMQIVYELGFDEVKMLLILRNPVEQALSLYKHRAKNGTAGNIEKWIQEDYGYHYFLKQFFSKIENQKVAFTCRKYQKENKYLGKVVFQDWLKIKYPVCAVEKQVNPSLSISELMFLEKLREYHPFLVRILYNRMLKTDKSKKAEEHRIEDYYYNVVASFIGQHQDVWEQCNAWLPNGEPLSIPKWETSEESVSKEDKVITLSNEQADMMAKFMDDCLSGRMKRYLIKNTLMEQARKWKNKILK